MRSIRTIFAASFFSAAILTVHAAEPDFTRDVQPVFAAKCVRSKWPGCVWTTEPRF
jgi:hypothetical protein